MRSAEKTETGPRIYAWCGLLLILHMFKNLPAGVLSQSIRWLIELAHVAHVLPIGIKASGLFQKILAQLFMSDSCFLISGHLCFPTPWTSGRPAEAVPLRPVKKWCSVDT